MESNINKVRRNVRRIYKDTDTSLKHVQSVCLSGCAHCCHQNIPVHAAEEHIITEFVDREFSEEQKDALSGRLHAWFSFMNENTPNRYLSAKDILEFGAKLISQRVPCPFLIDNLCSIYPVRPITCRTFYVSDNPDKCARNPGRVGNEKGYEIKTAALNEIARVADYFQIRLLPYAVAEHLKVRKEVKRGISSEVVSTLMSKAI